MGFIQSIEGIEETLRKKEFCLQTAFGLCSISSSWGLQPVDLLCRIETCQLPQLRELISLIFFFATPHNLHHLNAPNQGLICVLYIESVEV